MRVRGGVYTDGPSIGGLATQLTSVRSVSRVWNSNAPGRQHRLGKKTRMELINLNTQARELMIEIQFKAKEMASERFQGRRVSTEWTDGTKDIGTVVEARVDDS